MMTLATGIFTSVDVGGWFLHRMRREEVKQTERGHVVVAVSAAGGSSTPDTDDLHGQDNGNGDSDDCC